MNLNERQWQEFYIKDIFYIEINNRKKFQVPTGALVDKINLKRGMEPRITVTSLNNGIYDFYSSSDKNYRTHNNFISVSFLGTIFYHPYKASLDMKVHCLKLKDKKLNKYLAFFLITEIKKSIEDSSYGNQLSSTDLPRKKIMLPVNEKGEPDYLFMADYVRKIEMRKKELYVNYVRNEIAKFTTGGDK